MQQTLADQEPEHPDWKSDLAGTHSNLGNLHASLREWDQAEVQHRQALTLRRQSVGLHPHDLFNRRNLAQSLNNLGMLLLQMGKLSEAEKYLRECTRLRGDLALRNPGVPHYRDEFAWAIGNLGNVLFRQRRDDEAEKALVQTTEILQELCREFPGDGQWNLSLARACLNVGYFLTGKGRHEAALSQFANALQALERLPSAAGLQQSARPLRRDGHWSRASSLAELGRHQEALADWEAALARDDGEHEGELRRSRARTLARVGKHVEAATEAEALAPSATAEDLFELAGTLALCAGGEANSAEAARRYQDQTRVLLDKARGKGLFQDQAWRRRLDQDPAFETLRSSPWFLDWRKTLGP